MRTAIRIVQLAAWIAAVALNATAASVPPSIRIIGDWEIEVNVTADRAQTTLRIAPTEAVAVIAERHEILPLFNPTAPGWAKGVRLRELIATETTTPYLLDTNSLALRAGTDPASESFRQGEDFDADLGWGTVGRRPSGRITENQAVFISYRYTPLRIDSVVLTTGGTVKLRKGNAKAVVPKPPDLHTGERLLANIWLPGPLERLSEENLFPVLEDTYPEPMKPSPSIAENLLPKTMARLNNGGTLRILAWGDSVTDGTYLPANERWQNMFVARLRERFPQATIELITEAWGGRNTGSYLGEPPGSPHNYQEKVLAAKPDLIISEFVNDAGLNPDQVEERYAKLLTDFNSIGAEWIILTPHYVRPDWMGLQRQRDIDDDPRPYVAGLRRFAAEHQVALADASLRYGRLWRQGISYNTLMTNAINHPDARGMKLFGDALMELFP
jgi:lysophospholipase L1-like esterase